MILLRAIIVPLSAFTALFVAIGPASAGPLDPPAGPIAPTHKTLTQVEPRTPLSDATTPGDGSTVFRITQPGSYYLTGNILALGKNGVSIEAGNVTLDLAGFAVTGNAALHSGIFTPLGAAFINVTLRNGHVNNFGLSGVDVSTATGTLIEGIVSSNNGEFGIRTGNAAVIRFCAAISNTQMGIAAIQGGSIESCTAFNNGGHGFSVGTSSSVTRSVARANSGNGFDCSGGGAAVAHCSALGNNQMGINAQNSSVVESCVANLNNAAGIRATGNCLIRNNVCNSNGAGIHLIQSNDNRVEGNNVTDNVQGFDVDTGGNIIVRNTASGNGTNWNVVAGNVCLVVSAATGGAISGNAGGTAPGSTDPSANFTY